MDREFEFDNSTDFFKCSEKLEDVPKQKVKTTSQKSTRSRTPLRLKKKADPNQPE